MYIKYNKQIQVWKTFFKWLFNSDPNYISVGVNLTVQDLLHQDARAQNLYFNISEMKLSIISLYIISVDPKYDIIWTENSDVVDSFIS